MRNIRKFETFEDFLASQASVSGSGEYVEDIVPGFAYIREIFEQTGKGGVVYNKVGGGESGEDYVFGDIIYYDGTNKLKKVYYSAFTPDMGEKVGLVVVPTALSPDGNARMVAFGSVSTEESSPKSENDSTTYTPVEANWTNDLIDENQTFYNSVPAFYYSGETISGDGGSTYKASKPTKSEPVERYENVECADVNEAQYSSDVLSWGMPNPYTEGEYYIPKSGMKVVSPFLDNNLNTQDIYYGQETLAGGSIGPIDPVSPIEASSPNLKASAIIGGTNYNAFHDFSGFTWTYGCPPEYNGGDVQVSSTNPETTLKSNKPVPSPQTGAYFPHNYAREFYTDGTQSGDWYLPSAGEMGFLAARFNMVDGITNYLYNVGAIDKNGLDNLYLSNRVFYTSTVIENKSEISSNETIAASSVPGSTVGDYGAYPMLLVLDMSQQDEPYIGFYSRSMASGSGSGEILPFAMIKDGEIQHETGDYTVANGHQIKDLLSSESR